MLGSSMIRRLLLLTLVVFSNLTFASDELLDRLSPKLVTFLKENPTASLKFSESLKTVFDGNSFGLYYFYTKDDNLARAFHYYPEEGSVVIAVRENQPAIDELICIIFEAFNSQNEAQFKQMADKARAGSVSKQEFVRAMTEIEFSAVRRMRDLLKTVELNATVTKNSYYVSRFLACPDEFAEYLKYRQKIRNPERDAMRERELLYDRLREESK